MSDELKVLGWWASPFSHRVQLALKLKGVPYTYIEEDLSNKTSLLLDLNPVTKKIPVLVHMGNPIAESLVILEYIDDTWTQHPLLPKDPIARAHARFWAKFIDDHCLHNLWMSCWTRGEMQESFMEQTDKNLSKLEEFLKGKRFFGGDDIGFVDLAANLLTVWAGVFQEINGVSLVSEEKHPALWKWSQEFLGSDVVLESLPEREKLFAWFQAKKEAILVTKAPVY